MAIHFAFAEGTEIEDYIDTNERMKINHIFTNITVDNFSIKDVNFTNTEKNCKLAW